jgi:glyoxylate/hydroxypyruvate reductase A
MTPTVLLTVKPADTARWRAALVEAAEAAGLEMRLIDHPAPDPAAVDFMVFAESGPVKDFTPYTGLKGILNIWAGVEKVLAIPTLPHDVPLCRMVEPGLVWGMTDYVVGHVTRYHIDLDRTLQGVGDGWFQPFPPLARDRKVGVLGLGHLGADAARALAALRFDVAGWSRRPKAIEGVACHSGPDGLATVLARSEILVLLLPATPATADILDAEALARLPRGARIVNGGRGELIDDDALLTALDADHIAHATLDVFRQEPLPQDHPYRRHPRVTVTPHVASTTRAHTAAPAIVAQLKRAVSGEPLKHIVDRQAGY